MISETKPSDFNPKFSAVGIYLMYKGKFLLVRFATKYGRKWSNPSGKVAKDEDPKDAAIRETFEETGITVNPKNIRFLFKAYVQYADYSFEWYAFKYELSEKPDVTLSIEHDEYRWVTPKKALTYDLMQDEDWCIRKAFNIK